MSESDKDNTSDDSIEDVIPAWEKKLSKLKSKSIKPKKLSKKKSPKLHTGPRGGKYIIKKGKKIYQ